MSKLFILMGAINMLLMVMLGAFGAHGLKGILSENMMSAYQTGVQYHAIHALGLLFVGIYIEKLTPSFWLIGSGWLLMAGIILFSGSLYAMSISGYTKLGIITPFGGMSFILGWLFLIIATVKAEI